MFPLLVFLPLLAPPVLGPDDVLTTPTVAEIQAWGALEVSEARNYRSDPLELTIDDAASPEKSELKLPRNLRVAVDRGHSLRSRHLDSLEGLRSYEGEELTPFLDEDGYGVELWYAVEPLLLRSGARKGLCLGVGVRTLFAEADPTTLEGCLVSLSVRL